MITKTLLLVKSISSLDFEKLYPLSGQPGGETVEQDFSDTGIFSTVTCENVTVNSGFDIVFSGPFQSHGIFAISNIHVKENSSSSIQGAIAENTEQSKKTNETLKDDNIEESKGFANGFFNDFERSDFGLSDVITMPLSFINGLASNQCNSLVLPLPFVDKDIELPCMTSIYNSYFSTFLTIYQTITTGLIAYWVCINIFRMVQNFKNPDNDEIEVMEL